MTGPARQAQDVNAPDALSRPALRGLYAITSEALCRNPVQLEPAVRAAVRGGVRWVQYRDKWNPPDARHALAKSLTAICHDAGAGFIVNDDTELAAAVGADGVHLGKTDGSIAQARTLLGANAVIGISCSASIARAQQGLAEGATYAAFGRFFASNTKPDAPSAPLSIIAEARAQLQAPICVIGGINASNVGQLVKAGADFFAVVESVLGQPDPESAARQLLAAIDTAQRAG